MCLAVRVCYTFVATQRLDDWMHDKAARTRERARDFEKQGKDDQACKEHEPRADGPTLHGISVRGWTGSVHRAPNDHAPREWGAGNTK